MWRTSVEDLAAGAYRLEADVVRAAELEERYADLALGFVDAAVVAVCERLGEPKVATLDRRDFSVVVPRHVPDLTRNRAAGTGLRGFPEAVSAVRALAAAGRALAVASSSQRHRVDAALRAVGLDEVFTLVVGGDEVADGEPAPDVYLRAAERLGVAPPSGLA